MILQQWIMSCCGGKPSEAIRRIEAVSSSVLSPSRIYRALRQPVPLEGKLARVVVEASEGKCTLPELVDADIIRAAFVFTNPDLQQRGLEFEIVKATHRLRAFETKRDQAQALCDKQRAEVERLTARLPRAAAVISPPSPPSSSRKKPKSPPKRRARAA